MQGESQPADRWLDACTAVFFLSFSDPRDLGAGPNNKSKALVSLCREKKPTHPRGPTRLVEAIGSSPTPPPSAWPLGRPKQFLQLQGETVLEHSLKLFLTLKGVSQ